MRALACDRLSEDLSSLSLQNVELREPGPGEVKLRMLACALNFPDVLMVQGKYQHKPPLPFIPGMEGSGEIVSIGPDVDDFKVGDAVVGGMGQGGLAEEQIVHTQRLRRKPDILTFEEAASVSTVYLTAYVSLVRRGELCVGETLLVHGAAGGVGLAAVDVGKLLGATVIATASSDEKCDIIRTRGADHVINHGDGFRDQVKEITKGRGVDVIYDPVGGDVFDQSLRCIAWGGRLLVIGFASGRIPSVDANIPLIKGCSIIGVRAGEYGRRDPEKGAENIEQIHKWSEQGKIRPYIGATFPLDQAVEGLRLLQNRQAIGKVVITME